MVILNILGVLAVILGGMLAVVTMAFLALKWLDWLNERFRS